MAHKLVLFPFFDLLSLSPPAWWSTRSRECGQGRGGTVNVSSSSLRMRGRSGASGTCPVGSGSELLELITT